MQQHTWIIHLHTRTHSMSFGFKKLCIKAFKHWSAKNGFENNTAISLGLHYAFQSIAATIANARGDYMMKNMKNFSRATRCKMSNYDGGKEQRFSRKDTNRLTESLSHLDSRMCWMTHFHRVNK